MTKSTITREQLLEIIETDHVQCGEASYLARMALAAMDSEPVAEITEDLGRLFVKIHYPTTLRAGDKLYLHAQTATASEPVAWTWQHLKQWHVTNNEERVRDLAWDGVKVEPLYRHAQPAPVVPVTDAMAYAFHHALTDSPQGDDDVEDIKAGLRAALVNVFDTQPAPVVQMVPEEPPEHRLPKGNSRDTTYRRGAIILGWKLCRAAMLAAAPQEVPDGK
ncbi:MAG: hypothetical protein WGP72_11875 [Klebsiella quasipneumoniae]